MPTRMPPNTSLVVETGDDDRLTIFVRAADGSRPPGTSLNKDWTPELAALADTLAVQLGATHIRGKLDKQGLTGVPRVYLMAPSAEWTPLVGAQDE